MTRKLALPVSLLLATLAVASCRGDGGDAEGPGTVAEGVAAAPETPVATDGAMALEGRELFEAKGCTACHKLGQGRLVGPDLLGVTDRRRKDWIVAMIANPDSMLRVDATARRLLSEYYTPMQNMGVSRNQAEALYHYLRRETEEHGGTT